MAETLAASETGDCFLSQYLPGLIVFLELIQFLCRWTLIVLVRLFRFFIPASKKSVAAEVVLITGTGHGLGRLLALNFAKLGAKIVLWDINEENNRAVQAEIEENGGSAYAYRCDVSDEKQVEEIGGKVLREVGQVSILINNAGVLPGKPMMYLNSYQIKRTLEINTLAHFWTIRRFLPSMIEAGYGHIVAISSAGGIIGCGNLTDYCASKYAVVGLMDSLREDIYAQGKEECINLTVVCPATMNTGLVQRPKTKFPSLFPVLDVEQTAEIITDAILRNEMFVVIPPVVHVIYKITTLFPAQVIVLAKRYLEYTIEPNIH